MATTTGVSGAYIWLCVNMGRLQGEHIMWFKCEQFSQCEKLNPCQVYQIHARASALWQHSRRYVSTGRYVLVVCTVYMNAQHKLI